MPRPPGGCCSGRSSPPRNFIHRLLRVIGGDWDAPDDHARLMRQSRGVVFDTTVATLLACTDFDRGPLLNDLVDALLRAPDDPRLASFVGALEGEAAEAGPVLVRVAAAALEGRPGFAAERASWLRALPARP